MRVWPFGVIVLAVGLAAVSSGRGHAETEPLGIASAQILDGWREETGAHVAAIAIGLAPGWHTYWRIPGDVGIPPQFDWSGSENLSSLSYEWPRPEIFEEAGLTYFGYKDALILPVRLVPEDASKPITARLSLFIGVCKDICLPGTAEIAAFLENTGPGQAKQAVEEALRSRALTPMEAGLADVDCSLSPTAQGVELTAELTFDQPPGPGQMALVESMDPELWVGHPQSTLEGNRLTTRAAVSGGGSDSVVISRDEIRLTILDPTRVVDIQGCTLRG